MKKVWDKWTRIALVKRILVGLILGAILPERLLYVIGTLRNNFL